MSWKSFQSRVWPVRFDRLYTPFASRLIRCMERRIMELKPTPISQVFCLQQFQEKYYELLFQWNRLIKTTLVVHQVRCWIGWTLEGCYTTHMDNWLERIMVRIKDDDTSNWIPDLLTQAPNYIHGYKFKNCNNCVDSLWFRASDVLGTAY